MSSKAIVTIQGEKYKRTSDFIQLDGVHLRIYQRISDGQPFVMRSGQLEPVILPNKGGQQKLPEPEEKAEERKEEKKEKTKEVVREVEAEIVTETDLERADIVEAKDIAENNDLVLQYSAPFRNRKTGKIEVRKWLGVNAWKLGLIEGYIKQGYTCKIEYEDTKETRKCRITLKKGEQEIVSEGTYTKSRLKSFLHPAKEECFDTFAFRNAIKRIVSLRDVVRAVIETQKEVQRMGALPTREVEERALPTRE